MSSAETKHLMHVIAFVTWITLFQKLSGNLSEDNSNEIDFDPFERYGTVFALFLYAIRISPLFGLPQSIFYFLGAILFNCFKERVELKTSLLSAPFICFRIVTKGDYPEFVKKNLKKNMEICYECGLKNFIFEVVSEKPLYMKNSKRFREIDVSSSYETKTGAKFKARNLQYCLEDDINMLDDKDWICHLDEDTILSKNSVYGILNFCKNGEHQFGQGVVMFVQDKIINWFTTLYDSFRVSDDMIRMRFILGAFHKPIFGWRGSFVVAQVSAERDVSFDHGLEGSIGEDSFFGMTAFKKGYTFNFIEGEMFEQSPLTLIDLIKQRKRWFQGIFLVVHSKKIPIRCKFCLAFLFYLWTLMPFSTILFFLIPLPELPKIPLFDVLGGFMKAVFLYMLVFGIMKSFSHKYRQNFWMILLCSVGAILITPFTFFIENIAIVLGLFGRKDEFYVVKKEL